MSAILIGVESRTTATVDRVRAARERGAAVRIQGAGTWLQGGRPVETVDTLSVADDRGIVEYVPGDLTLTARAGTPLAEIAAATAANEQWLPLDPWGGDAGTLGATVSTATAGPYAHAMGLPRDVVLGVELVSGAGQVIRAGGRVVKNVAGFDLTRLVVGSWGTLGVITEVTVRLRARSEATRTVALDANAGSAQSLNDIATTLRRLPFTPLACELLHRRLASRLALGDSDVLLIRVAGNRRAVDAQIDLLRPFGLMRDAPEDVWSRLRVVEPTATATWRWSDLPSSFGQTWNAVDRATRQIADVQLHGSPMRGVVRAIVSAGTSTTAAELARAAAAFSGTVIIEALPRDVWPHVELHPASDPLSRAMRATFDPDRVLNRGILGSDA